LKHLIFILFLCGSWWLTTEAHAQLDLQNPQLSQISSDEIELWKQKKNLSEWETHFGAAEDWNPMQMEFFSQIKARSLSEDEKEALKSLSDEQWAEKYGEMDTWKVDVLLLYSLIQNLKND
jgi:hypothetical protein